VLAHAYQDKNVEAVNFEIASEYDASGLRKISRVTIDPYTGLHFWNTRSAEGYYCIVLKMMSGKKLMVNTIKLASQLLIIWYP
jgi:hypothetical protein